MKLITTLSFSILMLSATLNASAAKNKYVAVYVETPAKTVCIKAAGAADANTFFSANTTVAFEIYKSGTADELAAIVKKLKAVDGVASVNTGKATGDYQMLNVTLNAAKNKTYWINLFKAAGCEHIKLNANPIVELDKM